MDYINQIKQASIDEFSSEVTQNKYRKIAEDGLWKSEKILINKYFLSHSKVLDIGCGSGRTTIPLNKMGYDVIGVDITPEMINTAKKVAESKNLNIDYRIGDATDLEFSDNFFDTAIFANNGWTQIPGQQNRQKALNEIYRVLKPGGYFILTAHQRYYSTYYILFWLIKWIKYYPSKWLGSKGEVDYGDLFFSRNYNGKKLKQKQFIHITSTNEVIKQLDKAGFKIEMKEFMGKISKQDAETMRGSLSKSYNSFKSPVFYVCKKS